MRVYLTFFVQVSAESASQFGELVADPVTNELLHYTEKPETFVSTMSIDYSIAYSLACLWMLSLLAPAFSGLNIANEMCR